VDQRAPLGRDERAAGVPSTVDHSDSIVRRNSYMVTVNPELSRVGLSVWWVRHEKSRTICLVIFVHVDERVKVDITVEVHARPERGRMKRGE
jgi:hypothetical protein